MPEKTDQISQLEKTDQISNPEKFHQNSLSNLEWIFFEGKLKDLEKIENLIGLEITIEYEVHQRSEKFMPITNVIQETKLIGHNRYNKLQINKFTKVIKYRRIYDPKLAEPRKIISTRSNLFVIQDLNTEQEIIKLLLESNEIDQSDLYDYVNNNYSILNTIEKSFKVIFDKYIFSFYKYDGDDTYDYGNTDNNGWKCIIYKFVVNSEHGAIPEEIYLKSRYYYDSRDDSTFDPLEFVSKSEKIVWKFEEIEST